MKNPAIRFALISTGMLFIVAVAAVAARKAGYIDHDASTRILMVALGILMAAQASRSPKDELKRTPRGIAIQRFTGWAMTLASLAWTVIWLVAPIDGATLMSMVPILIGGAAVAIRCLTWRPRSA